MHLHQRLRAEILMRLQKLVIRLDTKIGLGHYLNGDKKKKGEKIYSLHWINSFNYMELEQNITKLSDDNQYFLHFLLVLFTLHTAVQNNPNFMKKL
jgi:hypothetical protein